MGCAQQPDADEMAVNHLLTTITALRNEVERLKADKAAIVKRAVGLISSACDACHEKYSLNAISFAEFQKGPGVMCKLCLHEEVEQLRATIEKIQALPEQLKAQAFNYGYERNLINIATSFEVAAKAIETHVLPLLEGVTNEEEKIENVNAKS